MRHRKKGKKLGRTAAHRKRLLQSLAIGLIKSEQKQIKTTVQKAKALQPFIDPLITRAKEDSEHNRRQVFRRLQDKQAVRELFDEIGPAAQGRPGGYTRVIRIGTRNGDGAEMAMIELVDYNDVKPDGGSSGRSRTRRGGGKGRRDDSGDDGASTAESSDEETAEATA